MNLVDHHGSWTLDFEYSASHSVFLSKIPAASREAHRGSGLELGSDTIQLINPGNDQPAVPYSVVSEDADSVTLTARGMTITLSPAEGDRLRFAMQPPGAPFAMDFYFKRA